MMRTSHPAKGPSAAIAAAEQDERDRRSNFRHTMSDLPWLNSARVKYGPNVAVLDLSRCGAQIETAGFRLQPGSTVVLEIMGAGPDITVPAHVLRCQVAGISHQPIYRGALVFNRTIDFPELAARPEDAGPPEANPLHEHARLSLALKRWSNGTQASVANPGLVTAVDADALAAALSMMNTPEARQAGPLFARELSRLFNTVTDGIDEQSTQDALLRRIADQLRRVVPARTIRLVEGTSSVIAAMTAPIWLDVALDDKARGARLLVDVAAGSSVAQWHLQYLKAAAHLIAAVRKLGRSMDSQGSREPRTIAHTELRTKPKALTTKSRELPAEPSELPTGWNKVVVRYTDGRLLKGYSREFTVSSPSLQVWPAPNAPWSTQILVPLSSVKAVFFVRDFAGDPDHIDDGTSDGGHGRRIAITFLDGETLMGTTLNYSPEAIGFFIRPADAGSNNVRAFVASRAIRHVQFPMAPGVPGAIAAGRSDSPNALAL